MSATRYPLSITLVAVLLVSSPVAAQEAAPSGSPTLAP